ncbi:hypothetical protein [Actinomadura verrucosospora]|uniref:MerR family transcriptional regulator n=1 Tax=Actinomadura verrucosospora TaxID=46165 RepID=A0A7D3ZN66_ACTVE|nr:hypothetical protein [Actinomadura verrucosospora]QKG22983.1 MerR family transcriptional regulator [Actinomadura verrucosospora]
MSESEVPIMCTLAPSSMVDRLTEFEAAFAAGLPRVEREPLRLRLSFTAGAERESALRDLFAQEQQCCAFLAFTFQRTADELTVDITAPDGAAPTLDGMQALAERAAPPEAVAQGWAG